MGQGTGAPLSAVNFLASSANRVRALDALTTEPHDRAGLEERVGISRVTAKRVLDEFETRGWVTRNGQCYQVTPLGEAIADEFRSLLDTITTMQKLSTVRQWLPIEAFDFDPRRFATARITHPSPSDSIAPMRRATERIRAAETLSILSSSVATQGLATQRDAVVEDGQSTEIVVSAGALDVIVGDQTMAGYLREIMDAGNPVYRHPGFEYILFDCDGSAVIGLIDETGAPRGLVESADEAVCEWVRETFEAHRAEAEPITAEAFTRRDRHSHRIDGS